MMIIDERRGEVGVDGVGDGKCNYITKKWVW